MKTPALVLALLMVACVFFGTSAWSLSNQMKVELEKTNAQLEKTNAQYVKTAKAQETERLRQLNDTEEDPSVIRSILRDLKISIEIQPQWNQENEFLIQVNLEKPLGKKYLVDAVEESCLLYVNKRLWTLLRQDDEPGDVRTLLEANLGSTHPLFRIVSDIPENSELIVEWVNYNPRTKQIERLQTKPYTWKR